VWVVWKEIVAIGSGVETAFDESGGAHKLLDLGVRRLVRSVPRFFVVGLKRVTLVLEYGFDCGLLT
jgi:hypothetical protein